MEETLRCAKENLPANVPLASPCLSRPATLQRIRELESELAALRGIDDGRDLAGKKASIPGSATSALLAEPSECPICYEEISIGNGSSIFITGCGHSFHFRCIRQCVMADNNQCPLCRRSFLTDLTPPRTPNEERLRLLRLPGFTRASDLLRQQQAANSAARRPYRPRRLVHSGSESEQPGAIGERADDIAAQPSQRPVEGTSVSPAAAVDELRVQSSPGNPSPARSADFREGPLDECNLL